jgi:hypothetical protein
VLAVLAERIVLTTERTIEVTWRDASGLSASVASARPELVARFVDAAPSGAEEAPAAAQDRPQSRAAKRAPIAGRRAA